MKKLFAGVLLATLIALPQLGRAEDTTRFPPLKAEELTPSQKAWADMIACGSASLRRWPPAGSAPR